MEIMVLLREQGSKLVNFIFMKVLVLGGTGSLKDIGDLIRCFGVVGAAASSLFVFKGIYRAVLINYPFITERDQLIAEHLL